jgi:hypothetical protein
MDRAEYERKASWSRIPELQLKSTHPDFSMKGLKNGEMGFVKFDIVQFY